jgi:hypothetical protein
VDYRELDNRHAYGDCRLFRVLAGITVLAQATGSLVLRLINWELAANPLNWIVVFLMLAIGTMAIAVIARPWSQQGSNR